MTMLSQMAASGEIKRNTLVWRNGMESWAQASEIPELNILFNNTPPEIPDI